MTTETKRDLHADLEVCKRATAGPWYAGDSTEMWQLFGGYVGTRQILKAPKRGTDYAEYWPDDDDARFIAESREGWPEAIRRAMAAESRLKEAEAEVERLRDENHTLTLTVAYQDEWKSEAERLRAVLERFDDRRHAMMPRSQMARISKEALDVNC